MRLATSLSVAVVVAMMLATSLIIVAPEVEAGWIDWDDAYFNCGYTKAGKKWLSDVPDGLTIKVYHGYPGTMTVTLKDPDGDVARTWTPNYNTNWPTTYYFYIDDYWYDTHWPYPYDGDMTGKWRVEWSSSFGSGYKDIYVGARMIDLYSGASPYYFNENSTTLSMGAETYTITDNHAGVAHSIGVSFHSIQYGTTNTRDIVIKTDMYFMDGNIGYNNAIYEMWITIDKVSWEGWGDSDSIGASEIDMRDCWGKNVTLQGDPTIGNAIGTSFATAAISAMIGVFSFGGGLIVGTVAAGLLSNYGASGMPDDAGSGTGDTGASAKFSTNGGGMWNASCFNEAHLVYNINEDATVFRIGGRVMYYDNNGMIFLRNYALPYLYVVVA